MKNIEIALVWFGLVGVRFGSRGEGEFGKMPFL